MFRVTAPVLLTSLLVACNRTDAPATPAPTPSPAVPQPVAAPPAPVLSAAKLTGKTFIYNHQLLDGSLEGPSVLFAADGKLTGAGDQTAWRIDGAVLNFLDANGTVRSRFDKVYAGPAGLFLLGHRTSDNKYHTLLELPPTK